jgi:hypothetical protein
MQTILRSIRGRWIVGTVLLLLAAAVLWLAITFIRKREMSLLKSCQNHASFIEWTFFEHLPATDKRTEPRTNAMVILRMPYDPSLPGYALFAKNTSGVMGGVNCNHGAPHCNFGGWQALNLPDEKLEELLKLWRDKASAMYNAGKWWFPSALPYAWCGAPTGSGSARVCITLSGGSTPTGWEWWLDGRGGSVKDDAIALLNECLRSIGEKEVPLNVPEGIDWMKFLSPAK